MDMRQAPAWLAALLGRRGRPGSAIDARWAALYDEAGRAVAEARFDEAERCASDLLAYSPRFQGHWFLGDAIHRAHIVLGLVACSRDDRETAARHLLQAADVPNSPQLWAGAVDFLLADRLLRLGGAAPVLTYLRRVRRLWHWLLRVSPSGRPVTTWVAPLARWSRAIGRGDPPDWQFRVDLSEAMLRRSISSGSSDHVAPADPGAGATS